MKIVTGMTSNGSNANWSSPMQQVTILDTTNRSRIRSVVLSNDGVRIFRPGTNYAVGIPLSEMMNVAVAQEVNLTWPPIIGTQPNNASVTAPNVATFSIAATAEISISYQWQNSTDNGSNWSNLSNTTPYSNVATNTLTVDPSNVSMNGNYLRCLAINGAGTTTSNSAKITVL